MLDYRSLEQQFSETLSLERRPVAVKFQKRPPAGVPNFTGTEPSGCSFWRLAASGRTFYTVPADHYNCAIGSYTHNIPLPQERAEEFDQTLSFMTGIGYIQMEEIPQMPRLPQTPGVVLYAPLGDTPVTPTWCYSRADLGELCSCRRPPCVRASEGKFRSWAARLVWPLLPRLPKASSRAQAVSAIAFTPI